MLDELSALRVLHKQDTAARLHNISLVAEMLSTGAQTRMALPASLTRAELGVIERQTRVGDGGLKRMLFCSLFSVFCSSAPLAFSAWVLDYAQCASRFNPIVSFHLQNSHSRSQNGSFSSPSPLTARRDQSFYQTVEGPALDLSASMHDSELSQPYA